MRCKSKQRKSVYDSVNANTNGHADEMLNIAPGYVHIQNLDVLASWILAYCKNPLTPFTIYGDYDVDGVCSVVMLYLLLSYLGAQNVRIRMPRRMSEGYGMHVNAVDEIDSGVVITVDNGIAAIDAIKKAKEKGLVVLVIDHHLPVMKNGEEQLPPADLIVDPHVRDELVAKGSVKPSGFRDYCGAGLVYKLAELLVKDQIFIGNMASFACLATIADVVPLQGDNRRIYRNGIWAIKKKYMTPGLQAVVDVLMSNNNVTESDIGFKIAPMLNAPGRLYDDGANMSVNTLLCQDFFKAKGMVEKLKSVNEERKRLKEEAVARANEIIEEKCLFGVNPIVIVDEKTPEGIIGLVAGTISETFNVSSFVFTKKGSILKGSARACEDDNIKLALDTLNDNYPGILAGYGGHAAAAGAAVNIDKINEFEEKIIDIMPDAKPKSDEILYDMEITAGDLKGVADELVKYAPFGEGNPFLVFKVNGFKLAPINGAFYSKMGRDTIRFNGAGCEAIGFSHSKKYEAMNCPMEMNIVGRVGFHYFMDKVTPQIEIMDFEPVIREREASDLTDSISDAFNMTGIKVHF